MGYNLPILGAVSLLTILPALVRLQRQVRFTTLTAAWNWAAFAWLFWTAAWILNLFPLPASVQDHMWYAVAILGLCPAISVLGAKRPGARVWTVFVVLPLFLVFAWPALVGWVRSSPPERLQLETPMLLGYSLVLVMGYGNYLGTRNSLASLLIASALGWLTWQFAEIPAEDEPHSPIGPTLLFVAGVLLGKFVTAPPAGEFEKGWDRIWRDFHETFGVVWAKRVMDRINQTAKHEHWSARLEITGFEWDKNATPEQIEHTRARIDHTFRWLLRRFVDPEWIDQKI